MKHANQLRKDILQKTAINLVGFLLLVFWLQPALGNLPDQLNVRDFTLKNGLRVLLLEDHKTPTVTLQVWYKVGSRNEQYGKTGISHLLEHMMFRGSKKYGPNAFSKIVQKNGGNDNAFTTEDYTMYFQPETSSQDITSSNCGGENCPNAQNTKNDKR